MGEGLARKTAIAALIVLLASLLGSCGSSDDQSQEQAEVAMKRYQRYVEQNATKMVTWATHMSHRVVDGRLSLARSRYASSRVPYGRIELVSETLGGLDVRINALPEDVPANELEGYHRIERAIWEDLSNDGVRSTAKQLLADIEELHREAESVRLTPVQLAEGAHKVIEETLEREIKGREERYARIDLVDLAANVEGAKAAFRAVAPQIEEENPELAREVEVRFRKALGELRGFGVAAWEPNQPRPTSPGTSFVLYLERSDAEYQKLGENIRGLTEVLAQVPEQLGET